VRLLAIAASSILATTSPAVEAENPPSDGWPQRISADAGWVIKVARTVDPNPSPSERTTHRGYRVNGAESHIVRLHRYSFSLSAGPDGDAMHVYTLSIPEYDSKWAPRPTITLLGAKADDNGMLVVYMHEGVSTLLVQREGHAAAWRRRVVSYGPDLRSEGWPPPFVGSVRIDGSPSTDGLTLHVEVRRRDQLDAEAGWRTTTFKLAKNGDRYSWERITP